MIFVEESHWAGVPLPLLTLNSVGPTLMALGTDEQKRAIPPRHPAGRGPLLHRLHRAQCRHRPGLAADPGRPRRRRVRDQRREALHQRHPVRRLRVAGGPHRPRRAQAQGPLGVHRPHRRPGIPLDPACDHGRRVHQLHLLRRGAGAGGQPGGRGEPGVEADHQPAQPRAGGHLSGVGHPPQHRRGPGLGPRRARWPTVAGSSTSSGCRSTWPGCRPGPSTSSCSTGRWPGRPTRASTRPTRRPPRCSAPSSPSRPTGCSSRSWARPATCAEGSPGAVLRGRLEQRLPEPDHLHLRGGTNEIQRDIIAMVGLGMPRAPR